MWQEQTWLLTRQAENKNNLHARYMHLGLCQDIEHPKSLLLFFGKWEVPVTGVVTGRVTRELLWFAQLACKEEGDFL